SSSAASATTGWITRSRSATASPCASPGSISTQRGARTTARRCWTGACRRCASAASVPPGSTRSPVACPGSAAGCERTSTCRMGTGALTQAWVALLIRRRLVGFLVDAAIHGFAIGAGFALVENLYYAASLHDVSPLLWLARGLGTAVMHGGATAMAAVVGQDLAKRQASRRLVWFAPGLAFAIVVHTLFNRLPLPPLLSTACVILFVPAIL